jgi:predicted transglutaminase-like cysteine proteinase
MRAVVLGLLVSLALAPIPALAAATEPLFGTAEVASPNLAPFPKWREVIDRFAPGQGENDGPCQVETLNRCGLEPWRAELDALAGLGPAEQLAAVNQYMNYAPYVIDPRNYGLEDYWALPIEFFRNDGDCEDYAIAKFLTLRALGWSAEDLRVVVLQDVNLQVAHAVIAAYVEGVAYILDNQVDDVLPSSRIRHYVPLYSINELGWWLHKP